MSVCLADVRVVAVSGDTVTVVVEPPSSVCASCGSSLCGIRKNRTAVLTCKGAEVGDRLRLEMPGGSILHIAFWLYAAGLLPAAAAAYMMRRFGETVSAVMFLAVTGVWVGLASRWLNKYVSSRIKVTMLR